MSFFMGVPFGELCCVRSALSAAGGARHFHFCAHVRSVRGRVQFANHQKTKKVVA